ncbi:Hermansky-Pudlak syndrome 1 protein homolog isoform X1 [Neodiprion virginianus]|uniref:Hermansky-Pudlak syndrome 1 protein homolog isoform X1 n=1 Tax=Neodiprion virginianus TaxID=2961670 RepID=UPI001EE6CCC2|nr:Hermansky-Pudlak syndrome 1 protein homolog isoform X1 [Neodiprion virginianus]XP_046623436.1 Hermansky-Pudlak syndrome 1 protein homolog isoform X1 [Neodiprion virginianus]
MRCILIFDHLNDVLFTKCNKKFAAHIQKLARIQGLIPEDKDENDVSNKLSPNTIIQLFAPIVTSQRVMACQFGNSYTSVQCQDGTNMVFDDFMGYMFVYIASSDVTLMKRTLGVCVSIVRHLCGPDVALLKWNKQRVSLVSSLLDAWITLRGCEQSVLVEAIEQLSVNPDLASATLRALHDATDKLRTQSEFSNVHALILVENKFLSLYSSKNSLDLSASDILLMMLLCWVAGDKGKLMEDQDNFDDDFLSPENSLTEESKGLNIAGKLANPTCKDITNLFGDSRDSSISEGLYKLAEDDLYSQLVLLGSGHNYTANAIHITELADGINLVIIIEASNLSTSSGLYDSFYYLNTINNLQLQKDIDELKPAFDNLDAAIKKSIDGIKKNRNHINNDIDMCQRRLQVKWEFIRKKYVELLKSRDPECVLRIESSTSGFTDTMKELLQLTCFDKNFLKQGVDVITAVSKLVRQKINDFSNFLKVKALKNFTLGSRTSLTINKYLEEFPGLVHFIYVDRTTHRLTAPTLDFTSPETLALTNKKIWTMVDHSRAHLQEGHLSVMWKDTTFNYAYFLWFEDNSGSPLKCKIHPNHLMKNLPLPGIICGDYYKKLVEVCFPKLSPNKIRIYELYCVHLGLATSSCVLEHSRRLAATIWEVTGVPNNPIDIL